MVIIFWENILQNWDLLVIFFIFPNFIDLFIAKIMNFNIIIANKYQGNNLILK